MQRPKHFLARFTGVLLTFHFVCLTWIFFRCDSAQHALEVLAGLARGSLEIVNIPWPIPVLIVLALLAQWWPADWYQRAELRFAKWPATVQAATLCGIAILVAWTSRAAVSQFIYFKF
jgi:signal transduction histidine kinase